MLKNFYKHLYFYVLLSILAGIVIGHFYPAKGVELKILSDYFIKLIKFIVGPLVFITVTLGIASLQDLKKAGRIGLKAIIYFEFITTLALLTGLIIINLIKPGEGFIKDPEKLKSASYIGLNSPNASNESLIEKIIPQNPIQPFIEGEILQILFMAVIFGIAVTFLKNKGQFIIDFLTKASFVVFKIVGFIMYLAPVAALGAMAFTIGQFGINSILPLGTLLLCVYLTCLFFILVILGFIAKKSGFNILNFIAYMKNELLIVLGTSSSESVLPNLMEKLEKLGCSKAVTGLVIPTGYSFNLDGTSIYLTMGALFIAQATNTPLSLTDQLVLIGIMMLTSKGAAAVTGGGIVTLAASLAAMNKIPLAGITLIVGIDRFMSEARALTNLIGNGVAAVVISNWEKETNLEKLNRELNPHNELTTKKQ